ncbi:MAG TPA: single-stranded DNA-binding protein [Planctomycetota bacterium]|nr:single-stranded DNA-binding protein [Planctomycetota bacterium]
MMADFNSVVLLGRLVRDPELRYAPSGDPVCSFSIATNHRYTKSDGQKVHSVTFVDVDAWRQLAELCSQDLKKGGQALISGTLKQDRWVDAKTQQPRSRLKVLAREVKLVGPRTDEEPKAEDSDAETPEGETSEV